jgi:hypothetical protein
VMVGGHDHPNHQPHHDEEGCKPERRGACPGRERVAFRGLDRELSRRLLGERQLQPVSKASPGGAIGSPREGRAARRR